MDTVNKNLSGSQSKSLEDAISDGLTSMDQKALTEGFQSVDAHNVNNSFSQMKTAEDAYNRVSTNTSSYDKTKSYGTNEPILHRMIKLSLMEPMSLQVKF